MKLIKQIISLAFLVYLFGGAQEGLAQRESVSSYDHVVIVLDASGSMRDTMSGSETSKMAAAKKALKGVVQTIPTSTRVGLLVFSASNTQDDWVYPLGEIKEKQLIEAIDFPRPSGSTPLGTYIKIGADRLLKEREARFNYGTYRLLVVTDGEATDGSLTDMYTPLTIARGIKIDVIGVDMSKNHTLATKVHTYRKANDPASLQKALKEVLGEVSSTNHTNTTTGEDVFAMIEPLPIEVASAAITALSIMENHPIGEERPVKPVVNAQSLPDNPAGDQSTESNSVLIVVIIIAVVLGALGFIALIS